MLGTVLTRLRLKVTSLISTVKALTLHWLSKITGVLIAMKTRFADSLTNLQLRLVPIQLKYKALHVSLTILVSSIKAAVTIVKPILTQIGLLLQTIAHQTLQLVKQVWNLGRSLVKKDTKDK